MRKRMRITAATLGLALLAGAPLTAVAQQAGGFTGWLHLGFRTLDISGGASEPAGMTGSTDAYCVSPVTGLYDRL